MFVKQIHRIATMAFVALVIDLGSTTRASGESAGELREFTGSRTRVAWVQDMGAGDDEQCEGNKLRLMGLDTEDGGSERPIVPEISNYHRPLITRGGDRVIYTNLILNRVFVVNWDGSELRELGPGLAEAVWRDPVDGSDWVYVRAGLGAGLDKKGRKASGTVVNRFRIDDPRVKETVWRDRIPLEDFQVSADGLWAVGGLPWPKTGIVNLATGTVTRQFGHGCWPSLSPDNSYRCWIFDGSHRNLRMYQPGIEEGWNVAANRHPSLSKSEVYHPRWSNHPHFLTATGPYSKVSFGGTQVEVYLGKFDADFHSIEKWIQITTNDLGNFYPDVWIESASRAPAKVVAGAGSKGWTPPPLEKSLPREPVSTSTGKGPVFSWESGASQGLVTDPESGRTTPAIAEARGLAVLGRNRELNLSNGSFVVTNASEALLTTLSRSNQLSIEAVIIPDRVKQNQVARIITFCSARKSQDFSLTQEGEHLEFRIRTTQTGPGTISPALRLCKLRTGQPNHVIVTFKSGRVICYLNGDKMLDASGPHGELSNWSAQHLVFGDDWLEGTADWDGRLEGVAIYDQALGLTEACERYDSFMETRRGRKPVEQIVVMARLLSVTPPPAPASIAPYRRALIVNDYAVDKVIAGRLPDKKFQASHWGVLDAKVLPSNWKVGSVYQLTLEKFSDQPQLEGERVVSESTDFGLDLFHAIEAGPLKKR